MSHSLDDRMILLLKSAPDPEALTELLLVVYGEGFTAGQGCGWTWAHDPRLSAYVATIRAAFDARCAERAAAQRSIDAALPTHPIAVPAGLQPEGAGDES